MHDEPALPSFVSQRSDGAELAIVLSPRSSKTTIGPVESQAIRVRVNAAPVDGAANAAMIRLLSDALRVPKSSITIVAGATSRRKRVLIHGLTARDALRRLALDSD